jgi:hypothetical protein
MLGSESLDGRQDQTTIRFMQMEEWLCGRNTDQDDNRVTTGKRLFIFAVFLGPDGKYEVGEHQEKKFHCNLSAIIYVTILILQKWCTLSKCKDKSWAPEFIKKIFYLDI